MAKRRSKSKSGSLKSQTITIIIGSVIVFILLVIGIKIGLVGWLVNLIFSVILFVAVIINSILAYKLFNKLEDNSSSNYIEVSSLKSTRPEVEKRTNSAKNVEVVKSTKILEERCELLQQLKIKQSQEIEILKKELSQLQEIEKQKAQITIPVQAEALIPKIAEPITVKPAPPKINSLFFDGPYDDRLFSETDAVSEKKFRYVYRIEYSIAEPSVGKLHLEPSVAEYDILRSYSDTVLKPACAFDNAFYSSFHNISQLVPGTVHKQGNDWYVKEKVKIRFN